MTHPAKPLLHIHQLKLTAGTQNIVEKLSLAVHAGQCVAIVGESGAGKSLTGRAIMGLLPAGITVGGGTITLDDEDLYREGQPVSEKRWQTIRGRRIAMVTQDALVSLDPLRTIGAEVAEPALIHSLIAPKDARQHAVSLLERVHVPSPAARAKQYPHQLSGGQRQRALIASGLSAAPQLLIADEPTTALDVHVQQHVISLLREVKDSGTGIILISHDLAVVAELADHIVVLKNGVVQEQGTARAILTQPTAAYTRELLDAHPDGQPIDLEQRPVDHSREVLSARNLHVRFRQPGGTTISALDDVSLSVHAGETVGLVGESGSGKSTLLRVLLGLQEPDHGYVEFDGMPWNGASGGVGRAGRRGRATISERERRAHRPNIQLIAQDPYSAMNKRWSVERIIAEGLRHATSRSATRNRVLELMDSVGLDRELASRTPARLSGGQRQRVAIARALAAEPTVLLCDEPVSALDVTIAAQVVQLLVTLQAETGIALVFISHDSAVVHQLAHTVVELHDGAVVRQYQHS